MRGEDGEVREGLQEPSWCVESPSLPRGRGRGGGGCEGLPWPTSSHNILIWIVFF